MKKAIINFSCFIKEQPFVRSMRIRRARKKMLDTSNLDSIIKLYRGDLDIDKLNRLKKDMIQTAKQYHFRFDEYLCYRFDERTQPERDEFVPNEERVIFCENVNKARNLALFENKAETAEIYKKYYKRDVCAVYGKKDYEKLSEFVSKHPRFIVKPINESCGDGVKIIDLYDSRDKFKELNSLINDYCHGILNGFIAEQLIVQSKDLGQFHPSSVNTIRITTLKMDDETIIIHPFLKLGRGGKVVDNGGQGGLLCLIEPTEGIITNVADEYGVTYTVHPDSKLPIVGFKMPHWNEAISLAKELAEITPDNRYTGWDFALTDGGWVMVEGNARGQFIGWQLTSQKGFKKEANSYLERLNIAPLK